MKGCRPIATNTESKFSFSPSEKTNSLLSTLSIEVFNLKFTPLFVNCFLNSADVLLSKPGRISSSSSTTVTSESRSTSKLANSHPIAPAPTIQTFFGGSS